MKPLKLAEVLALPVPERLKLVEEIWDSIAAFPESVELTPPQEAELERRLESYQTNPTEGSPWADVQSRILKRA